MITSANATFTLTIPGVYNYAVPLQEFAVDDSFTADAVEVTEIRVGVDGYGVGGLTPVAVEVKMVIELRASSPSIEIFENWLAAMAATNDVYYGIGVISQPSLGRKYIMPRGHLQRTASLAVAKEQHREFTILWLPQGPGVPAIRAVPV
jgi:hypothetical protein